jgi:hypothetical protein
MYIMIRKTKACEKTDEIHYKRKRMVLRNVSSVPGLSVNIIHETV